MADDAAALRRLISDIEHQEATLVFPAFGPVDAWRLGCALVARAEAEGAPVAIDIQRGEQRLFHAALTGSSADNDAWIERKCALVRRFGVSSFLFGRRLALAGKTLTEATLLDPAVYAAHGGAFPISVAGAGPIGTVAVSGLPQADDHRMVVEGLTAVLG
ncbi:Uncharacterized protein, UPF0303 family [Nakamurella panacisegetis]|uniref:Uncharacterized protein, UPF0303 family n=1 Tax=Nakamurella panacisegetis TaxID=1090615 RepID=A0A1H0M0D0_9ACTN|nr:heme-degrading domain-containing protein [Nakamurella panacisegetis]SDO73867.1 Uncharacterized protein, UPF0303 family [Nakamurella panacisegetis]